jgi:tetratricopeptide (TPR) repeat protein
LTRPFHLGYLVLFAVLSVIATGQQRSTSAASIESLIRSGQLDEALQLTHSALRERPGDARVWTLQGIALSLRKNTREALAAFDEALRLSPAWVPALRGKAELLYRTEDSRAIPILQTLLKLDPKDAVAHEMLGVFEARAGNCTTAIGHFESSASNASGHPVSLELYGYCLQRTGQLPKAIAAFQQLTSLVPEQAYAKYDLAVLQVDTKQYVAALATLQPLLGPGQSDPDIFSLAAEAYEAMGDTPNAVSHLRQAVVLNPKDASYYTAFAILCLDHESYEVGVNMLALGVQQIPGDPALYVSRGLLYAQMAQYDKAETDFKMAESLDPQQSLSSYAMDLAEVEKDRPDLALAKVRAQLISHPNSAQHYYLLAKLLVKDASAGDARSSQEAIAAALKAVELRPTFVQARDLLASLYLSSEQYQPAKEQSELALKDDPLDQAAIYHLIVALRHSASAADREELQKCVKLLAQAQQAGRERDLKRKAFKLVEESPGHESK